MRLGLEALAERADLLIIYRARACSTMPMVSARVGRATHLSAEQLQANKNLGAKAVATMVEYFIKYQ